MPFDEEDEKPSNYPPKVALKKVSTQKSIFETQPRKPSAEEFEKKVQQVQDRAFSYKTKAAELALEFNKAMTDRTLKSNKTVFSIEIEQDLLAKMIQLAIEINADPIEQEGMGSLSWITLLLKTCFTQRDRINFLEYSLSQIDKKMESIIIREINKSLDKKKNNE